MDRLRSAHCESGVRFFFIDLLGVNIPPRVWPEKLAKSVMTFAP
jgi:hypothetical protein